VATSPTDRARTRIGVGEEVTLTASPGPATWTVSGGGTVSPASGTTTTYTAGDAAGTVTITGTGTGCTGTITFTVVEPSNWTMARDTALGIKHTLNRPDCGFKGIFWVHPNDVNFYRVEIREQDSLAVATGAYTVFTTTPTLHGNYAGGFSAWLILNRHDPAKGSSITGRDTIYSGDPGSGATGAAPPFTTGTMHFSIVFQWKVGSGSPHTFSAVRQEHEIIADGHCESRKGGHTQRTMYTDATSSY